ncbi:hypothetical protein Cgig2_021949 [Carnegiea gigantea]|uniref:Uncharacterized protein n=1 Tax=Carnegiea gigantea TaxID=171969 RepID=A0A9Q1QNV0_9CARY|nr:hypothetical protein Cgig2_021949 [Carnegiea gigantea]
MSSTLIAPTASSNPRTNTPNPEGGGGGGLTRREKMNGLERQTKLNQEEQEEEEGFSHGDPPPFRLADVRAAIPKHCWVKDPWKSMSYVVRDLVVVLALMAIAFSLDSWGFWPFYWFAQGTIGHGSFSNSKKLNSVVGHTLHTSILVPYHGWRISHRIHHANHAHVENDESWRPMTETLYKGLPNLSRMFRHTPPFPLFLFPYYLQAVVVNEQAWREPGKKGSHFHPESDLFTPSEKLDVVTSTICWCAMVALLATLCFIFGPTPVLKLYGVPYLVFIMWLGLVTYLNHHGDGEERLPRYRGKGWNHLRGALSTLDRDYGMFNNIHHHIETHVIHHLFPQIPHYHLVEATKAAKPIMGKYYKEPKKSAGPFPFHVIGIFLEALRINHFVSDSGDIVYYETDPHLTIGGASKCM